jgi:hypothetical protein
MEAISHAGTALGVLSNEGVVLVAEKKTTSKLLDQSSVSREKLYKLNKYVVSFFSLPSLSFSLFSFLSFSLFSLSLFLSFSFSISFSLYTSLSKHLSLSLSLFLSILFLSLCISLSLSGGRRHASQPKKKKKKVIKIRNVVATSAWQWRVLRPMRTV